MKSIPVVRAVFFLMAAVLLASLAATWWIGQQTLRKVSEINDRETSLRQLPEAFSTLQDAETGQRGFLLTGQADYLTPYQAAVAEWPLRVRRLRKVAQNGEFPAALWERFERHGEGKMQELAESLRLAREQGPARAVEFVRTNSGLRLMEAIRADLAEITADEEAHLREAEKSARALTDLRMGVFAGAGLLNLGFLVWAFRRIRREISHRYVADLETQRQREVLAVSLASIGDAVILTDTETRIIFLNDVAAELTGWTREEALGRECSRVFHIINQTNRKSVESPVDRVLRTGRVVGLANHTLLVRKDGSEVPIADSGAPVREPDGAVRGVVLVFRDFSKYKNVELELRSAKDRLETANQAKDDFLAALSHELRTPLTPVLATLSSWEANGTLPAPIAADVRMLSRNVRLEVRLIDDLLDLTRITRGEIALHREQVDAHALLAAVVETFRHPIEERQIRLGVRPAAERCFVEGDPARLQQVFWNILGNAVKFTPAGGRIEIVTTNEGDDLRVTIADNGRGMSEETRQHLFRPFERPAERAGYQSGGLGIGLAISQNLMHAHHGEIEVRSSGLGLGTTFVVRLPALATTTPAAVATREGGKADPAAPALSILLVEDHEDTAMVIGRIVGNMGHRVQTSHTVADALVRLRSGRFDLVLSDIGLPDGTGIELLAQARKFCNIPTVALTGYGMENDLAKYRAAGFLHQLTKPIRFDQLEKLLAGFAETASKRGGLTVHATPAS